MVNENSVSDATHLCRETQCDLGAVVTLSSTNTSSRRVTVPAEMARRALVGSLPSVKSP